MRRLFAVAAVAFSVVLSGCMTSTPDVIAHRAIDAAKRKDLDLFRLALTPRAQSTLGTKNSMLAIGDELRHYRHVSVGPAILVSTERGDLGGGYIGDALRSYETPVFGSPRNDAPMQVIYTVSVRCAKQYQAAGYGSSRDEIPVIEHQFVEFCAIDNIAK